MAKLLLTADIGGTKVLLQLSEKTESGLKCIIKQQFQSADFSSWEDVLSAFLPASTSIYAACFAVAGPVTQQGRQAQVTNLPWLLERERLQQKFNIEHLKLINDFQAVGYGATTLTADNLLTLQAGNPDSNGTRAVIGAGTGLGQAILVPDGKNYQILATEGGHVDFAPTTPFESALLQYLTQSFSHVSYERILSGSGILNLYQFFLHIHQEDPAAHQEVLLADDPAVEISRMAQEGKQEIAMKTMQLFVKIYGAQAGNLALNCLPGGGVFIAGGIALKNLELMQSPDFIRAFNSKGRMQALLESIPVYLVLDREIGLTGANALVRTM